MANGTSTSHVRLTIAEILESPGRHEAYLAEAAVWASGRMGGPAPEPGRPDALFPSVPAGIHRNTITITGNTERAATRLQVTDALLGEADWLAERLAVAKAAERTWIAHVLVFTGLGRETTLLSEVRSRLYPRLLRKGIVVGEFHRGDMSSSVRERKDATGLSPWPCFVLRAPILHDLSSHRG